MKKILLFSFAALFVFVAHHPAHASEVIQSQSQVRVVSQLFEAEVTEQMNEQANWDSCTSFRTAWQNSFHAADADLEASFTFYARASASKIQQHREAFELVKSIAEKYQHNNCRAIPGTFAVIANSRKVSHRSTLRY
ncbi:hypothetical protein F3F96_05750 [Mariprofundus sp. NF]|uniref:hypothetical protein n=1 Tax=Mariprofundus sp. NF TaxID=2608716 RepID=UPI0015A208CD|nr:hypothetical protein [Mariprofundus sp. NF]NWF38632.1 hypothetical protein [Mariprofundus sp. NF]